MTINERIIDILKQRKDLTQKEMSINIGVASSTVNNWLKLGRSIPAEYIIPISEFLNISCEYLLTGQNAKSDISDTDQEWIELIHRLPQDAQYEFRGEIKGYLKCLERKSVAAEGDLKQAK